ncbi:recombinase family protein [Candidatus Pacearchaeota archaeon]|nr:recombinase family protein [Candidatus Pacearchaeota archaeon]
MTQTRPLAAIYIRVSTQDQVQHGFSLDAQQESLENYAQALGYEVYKIYRDEGKSAKNLNRPEMQQMLEDAEQKKFSAIFIYKLDRFSRSLKDLILTIDQLKEWNIDFVSLQDKIETASASGKLMFQIIGAFAEFERNMIGDRTKFGMERKAKEGGFITKAPKGYCLVNKQLIMDKEESQKVREIFEEFLNNNISLTKLAKKNNLTTSGIKKLLQNTTYLGKVKFANNETQGQHPAIIDKQLFEQVKEKLKKICFSKNSC